MSDKELRKVMADMLDAQIKLTNEVFQLKHALGTLISWQGPDMGADNVKKLLDMIEGKS